MKRDVRSAPTHCHYARLYASCAAHPDGGPKRAPPLYGTAHLITGIGCKAFLNAPVNGAPPSSKVPARRTLSGGNRVCTHDYSRIIPRSKPCSSRGSNDRMTFCSTTRVGALSIAIISQQRRSTDLCRRRLTRSRQVKNRSHRRVLPSLLGCSSESGFCAQAKKQPSKFGTTRRRRRMLEAGSSRRRPGLNLHRIEAIFDRLFRKKKSQEHSEQSARRMPYADPRYADSADAMPAWSLSPR